MTTIYLFFGAERLLLKGIWGNWRKSRRTSQVIKTIDIATYAHELLILGQDESQAVDMALADTEYLVGQGTNVTYVTSDLVPKEIEFFQRRKDSRTKVVSVYCCSCGYMESDIGSSEKSDLGSIVSLSDEMSLFLVEEASSSKILYGYPMSKTDGVLSAEDRFFPWVEPLINGWKQKGLTVAPTIIFSSKPT